MLGIGGFLVVGGAATDRRVLTAAGSVLALLAGVIAMAIRRPARPWAWRSLLLGSAVTVFILVALARTEGALNLTGRVADIVVVVFYATVAAGLILVGGRAARRDLADTLDATIVALGVFLLMWLFLLGGRFTPTDQAFAPAYVRPIALAALAGILTRLVFVVDRRTPSFRLLVAGNHLRPGQWRPHRGPIGRLPRRRADRHQRCLVRLVRGAVGGSAAASVVDLWPVDAPERTAQFQRRSRRRIHRHDIARSSRLGCGHRFEPLSPSVREGLRRTCHDRGADRPAVALAPWTDNPTR